MSSQNACSSAGFDIALPPNLITQRVPVNREMYDSASTISLRLKLGL